MHAANDVKVSNLFEEKHIKITVTYIFLKGRTNIGCVTDTLVKEELYTFALLLMKTIIGIL